MRKHRHPQPRAPTGAAVPVTGASKAGGVAGDETERTKDVSEIIRDKQAEREIQPLTSKYYHGRPLSGETPSDQLPQKLDKTFEPQTTPKRVEFDSYQKKWGPSTQQEPIGWVVGEQGIKMPQQLGVSKPKREKEKFFLDSDSDTSATQPEVLFPLRPKRADKTMIANLFAGEEGRPMNVPKVPPPLPPIPHQQDPWKDDEKGAADQ